MKRVLTVIALATAMVAGQAAASEGNRFGSTLAEYEQVYAPRGFQNLCAERPEFCISQRVDSEVSSMLSNIDRMFGRGAVRHEPFNLTAERYRTLQRVNITVNETIHPTQDAHGDVWSFNAMIGDCEEYVLMKREVLARLGWPRSAMRIAVVTGAGEDPYHAVLVVTTNRGDFVLDNLTNELTRVTESSYEFVVSESFQQPGAWVRVRAMR